MKRLSVLFSTHCISSYKTLLMLQITSSCYWRNAINVAKDKKGDFEIWCIPFRDQSVKSPKACQNVQYTSTTRKAFRYITYIQSTMCLQCQWYSHKVFLADKGFKICLLISISFMAKQYSSLKLWNDTIIVSSMCPPPFTMFLDILNQLEAMQLNEDIIEAFFYNICFILEWSKDIKFTTIYNHYISLLMMKNCKLFVTHKKLHLDHVFYTVNVL